MLRHIVLVGLMATGKTTVGSGLAEALGRPFSDSDAWIERESGKTVGALADEIGVDEMHALEAGHLMQALAEPQPSVIAAAASTIDDPACREALADPGVTVIWVHGDPAVLAQRFDAERHRPRFGLAPEDLLAEQAAERDPLFRSLDPIEVETDDRAPADAVAAALTDLKKRH